MKIKIQAIILRLGNIGGYSWVIKNHGREIAISPTIYATIGNAKRGAERAIDAIKTPDFIEVEVVK